jgi:hypothetical protein
MLVILAVPLCCFKCSKCICNGLSFFENVNSHLIENLNSFMNFCFELKLKIHERATLPVNVVAFNAKSTQRINYTHAEPKLFA